MLMDLKSFVHVHTKLKPYTRAYYEGIQSITFPQGESNILKGGAQGDLAIIQSVPRAAPYHYQQLTIAR